MTPKLPRHFGQEWCVKKRFRNIKRWLVAGAALTAIALVGAGTWESSTPRMRFGSLPFPGRFTLYTAVSVEDLGVHRHGAWARRVGETDETGTGILYTRGAGFLDLAHIREYVDWGKYIHDRALDCLSRGSDSFTFDWSGGTFTVRVTRPGLDSLPPEDRVAEHRAMARQFAQRMVIVMGTWHEAATWHGESTFPGISETRSAFTWDDTSSHVVASWVVGRALQRNILEWDDAVTLELAAQLDELGATDQPTGARAVQAIYGSWWIDDHGSEPRPLRRDFDTGLYTGVKHAWLAPGFETAGPTAPLLLPAWPQTPRGTDLSAAFRVTVTTKDDMAARMLGEQHPESQPSSLQPERDLPRVIELIREQAALRGEESGRPDSTTATHSIQ